MSAYKEIKGLPIRALASDPSVLYKGQTWYNTTDDELKVRTVGAAAWSVGGVNPHGSFNTCGSGGSTKDAAMFAGAQPSIPAKSVSYNGTAFTELADMIIGRGVGAGFGSGTTFMMASGSTTGPGAQTVNNCETYNGIAWSETANLGTGRYHTSGCGSSGNTAGLVIAGSGPGIPGAYTTAVEEWNGIAWSGAPALTGIYRDMTTRNAMGSVTAALVCCGRSTPPNDYTKWAEAYNGIAWSSQPDTIKGATGPFGFGVSTDAGNGGGYDHPTQHTSIDLFNGISWSSGTSFPAPGMSGQTGQSATTANAMVSCSATGITGACFEYVKGPATEVVTST